MREIKFRAYLKKEKVYADVDVLVLHQGLVYISFNEEQVNKYGKDKLDEICMIQKSDDIILEQYTGLKDKNGEEIADGDIVEVEAACKNFLVRYEQGMCAFSLIMLPELHCDVPNTITQKKTQNQKIIGNIHENPELLKGEEK